MDISKGDENVTYNPIALGISHDGTNNLGMSVKFKITNKFA